MTTLRFAPSPTGHLHVGNLRTAITNWLYARQSGGQFLLRLDDTDTERSRAEYADAIRRDLAWLGMAADDEVRQSDRTALYEAAFDRLLSAGRIYPAYETPEELDVRRKVLLSRGKPPIYDRAALSLTDEERAALEAEGRRPHWRFRLDDTPIEWSDLIRGPSHLDPAAVSDPVVRRADGTFLYMLPSVVDDIDMGVTHVVRGEDHVTNSGVQVQMFEALGTAPPTFAHQSLLVDQEGGKLSKRLGSLSARQLREQGIEPLALLAYLARLGTSQPVESVADSQALIDSFAFDAFGRAPARFGEDELAQLNAKIVHGLPYEAVSDRLPEAMTAEAWAIIRPNLERLADAADWWSMINSAPVVELSEDDAAYAEAAAESLAAIDGDELWGPLVADLKSRTGRKGRALFQPLRLALTGQQHGPEMAGILALIGKDEALRRLRAAAGQ